MRVKKIVSLAGLFFTSNFVNADLLDHNRYDVQDIKVTTQVGSNCAYPIYANGRMQAPVNIAIKVLDKNSGEIVNLSKEQLEKFIVLTDSSGNELTFEQPASRSWSFTFKENEFLHRVKEPMICSNINTETLNDEWSSLNTYVYTKDEVYAKIICASVKFTNEQTMNSCSGNFDEFVRIESKAEKKHPASAFLFRKNLLWDNYPERDKNAGKAEPQMHYRAYEYTIRLISGDDLYSIGRKSSETHSLSCVRPNTISIDHFSVVGDTGGSVWGIPCFEEENKYTAPIKFGGYEVLQHEGRLKLTRGQFVNIASSASSRAEELSLIDKYGNEATVFLQYNDSTSAWVLSD
ncbi:hypothetical protein H0A36_15175 [Endozoicomonas sp. SM1973]|uniref:Uncharacterized protein n=1 Tax=Spartinivicinus marinus TaxID=2994442 RepID=A0A853I9M4_9GAMM|nr:hypothetical protein [Spartinivicinus marinus]MCX4026229.1 hypothetical protein [Spartinivicinus marinus]NYZ67358.1 hypothetical protein [Spartinivicinus marinus]